MRKLAMLMVLVGAGCGSNDVGGSPDPDAAQPVLVVDAAPSLVLDASPMAADAVSAAAHTAAEIAAAQMKCSAMGDAVCTYWIGCQDKAHENRVVGEPPTWKPGERDKVLSDCIYWAKADCPMVVAVGASYDRCLADLPHWDCYADSVGRLVLKLPDSCQRALLK